MKAAQDFGRQRWCWRQALSFAAQLPDNDEDSLLILMYLYQLVMQAPKSMVDSTRR